MKKRRNVGIGLAGLLIAVLLHYQFGLFERYSMVTACWDICTGKERIVVYGEMSQDDVLKAKIAPDYGFEYEVAVGCVVTTPLVNGMQDYNAIMGRRINKRLEEDWEVILQKAMSEVE